MNKLIVVLKRFFFTIKIQSKNNVSPLYLRLFKVFPAMEVVEESQIIRYMNIKHLKRSQIIE